MDEGLVLRGPRTRHLLWLMLALIGALATGAVVGTAAGAQSGGGGGIREYVVGPPADFPESVVYDEKTQAFYGGSASGKTGGTLFKATLDDRTAEEYLPANRDGGEIPEPDGRTEADGVTVDKQGRLYVAGGGTGNLFVYDIKTRELVARFATGAGAFINDVTIAPNGDVYFTDSNRPFIFRATRAQVDEAEQSNTDATLPITDTPQAIEIDPPVDYTDKTTNPDNPLEANGIRPTPDGKFLVFGSLNDQKLYRLTPPEGDPETVKLVRTQIKDIEVSGGSVGDNDGLEFIDGNLYVVDNDRELIIRVQLSDNYLEGRILSFYGNKRFQTPTDITPVPGGRLLVPQAEFFADNGGDQMEPFFVLSIPLADVKNGPPAGDNRNGCTVRGTDRSERLRGTDGTDVICGFGGNDIIEGRGGDDVIIAGSGNDRTSGGDGDDTIHAGRGNDILAGGEGNDDLFGQKGNDLIQASDGEEGNDFADGGPGRDRCGRDRGDTTKNCP